MLRTPVSAPHPLRGSVSPLSLISSPPLSCLASPPPADPQVHPDAARALAHTPHEHVERNSLDYAKSKLEELSR